MKSQAHVSFTDRAEPMVTWPKNGSIVPLAVWEKRNSNEWPVPKPKPAQARMPSGVATSTTKTIPPSTAKARGLAALSNQMQTFVPRESRTFGNPMVAHNTVQTPMSLETFDLTAEDSSVVSDTASSWSLLQQ